jgi:hypothetical protein
LCASVVGGAAKECQARCSFSPLIRYACPGVTAPSPAHAPRIGLGVLAAESKSGRGCAPGAGRAGPGPGRYQYYVTVPWAAGGCDVLTQASNAGLGVSLA